MQRRTSCMIETQVKFEDGRVGQGPRHAQDCVDVQTYPLATA